MNVRNLVGSLLLSILALVALPRQAFAQAEASSNLEQNREMPLAAMESRFVVDRDELLRLAESTIRFQPDQPPRRDSLKNGAIIGAVVGAAALGTFGGLLCKALQEPGTSSCVDDTLRIAAVGGAIGLGAGLAIDAALMRQSGARLSWKVRF